MAGKRPPRLEQHHLLTMAGLSEHLKNMGEPVRSGQSLASALTATRLNGIINAIRALSRGDNVMAGYGLRRASSSEGVMLSAGTGGRSGSSAAHPFQVLGANTSTEPKISVVFGQVNSITPTIGGYEIGTDDPPTLRVETGVVYLAVIFDVSGKVTSASIHNGAALPDDDVTHGYLTLARVTVTKNAVTDIRQSITHSLGVRRCGVSDIHFWGY